jgi:hypothetical protein
MKKIYLALLCTFLTTAAMSQKVLPQIKTGTIMLMELDFHGQPLQLTVTYKGMGDPMNISWDVGTMGGTYNMSAKGLASGTRLNADQPQPDAVTALTDEETFLCISKAAYQSLVKNKTFDYSGLTFKVKDNSDGFKLDGKLADATYVSTADGKATIWILNNPDMPVILAITGNPSGINNKITAIK